MLVAHDASVCRVPHLPHRRCSHLTRSTRLPTFLRTHTEPIDTNLFRSRSLWKPPGARGVFGGQIIGQSLAAAHQTVDTALLQVHSLHSLFIRAGDCTIPVIYRVDRVRDGRSFCTRSVRGERKAAALSAVSTRQWLGSLLHCPSLLTGPLLCQLLIIAAVEYKCYDSLA